MPLRAAITCGVTERRDDGDQELAAVIADALAAGRPTIAAQSSINLGGVLA